MLLNNFGGDWKNQYFDHTERESQRSAKRLTQHHTFFGGFLEGKRSTAAPALQTRRNARRGRGGAAGSAHGTNVFSWSTITPSLPYSPSEVMEIAAGVCWRNLFTSAPPHILHTRAGTPDVAYSLGQMHCTDSMWRTQSPAHALNTLARTFCLCPMSSLIPVTNFLEVQILWLTKRCLFSPQPNYMSNKSPEKGKQSGSYLQMSICSYWNYCLQDFLYFKGFPNQFAFIIMNVLQFLVLSLNNKTGSGVKDPIEFATLI